MTESMAVAMKAANEIMIQSHVPVSISRDHIARIICAATALPELIGALNACLPEVELPTYKLVVAALAKATGG